MPKIRIERTIEECILDFIDYCNLKDLSKKTIKSYYQSLMMLNNYLAEEKKINLIRDVDREEIEEYIAFVKERGKYTYVTNLNTLEANYQHRRRDINTKISNTTVNNYIRNIKVFFNWLAETRVIKKTNVSKIKLLKNPRKPKEQLDYKDIKKLLATLDITKFHEYRDFIIIQMMLDTGMRLTETLNLTTKDFDFNRRVIYVNGEFSKGNKDRVVFYSQTLSKYLNRWIRFKDCMVDTDYLFPSLRSANVVVNQNFERNFRVYRERAGFSKNITPHSLRNSFGRHFLLNSGGDIFTLSKLLGHSNVSTTEAAYADITTEDLRSVYNKNSPLENLKKR